MWDRFRHIRTEMFSSTLLILTLSGVPAIADELVPHVVWAPIGPERTAEEIGTTTSFVESYLKKESQSGAFELFIYCPECQGGDEPVGVDPVLPTSPIGGLNECWKSVNEEMWVLTDYVNCKDKVGRFTEALRKAPNASGEQEANGKDALVFSLSNTRHLEAGDPAAVNNTFLATSPIGTPQDTDADHWVGWAPRDACLDAQLDYLTAIINGSLGDPASEGNDECAEDASTEQEPFKQTPDWAVVIQRAAKAWEKTGPHE